MPLKKLDNLSFPLQCTYKSWKRAGQSVRSLPKKNVSVYLLRMHDLVGYAYIMSWEVTFLTFVLVQKNLIIC